MKHVYKAIMETCVINGFNTTEYIVEPNVGTIGLFTNKKKALKEIVDTIGREIEMYIEDGKKLEVELYNKVDYDISCRIETYGYITWYMGKVERIKVC